MVIINYIKVYKLVHSGSPLHGGFLIYMCFICIHFDQCCAIYIAYMKEFGIWEPYSVKTQTYKTAMETAILLLRIDDIVSGSKRQMGGGDGGGT